METPPTPEHVRPDEEVNIPSDPVSLDLDLNPDLENEDDIQENPFTRNTPLETPLNTPSNTRNDTPSLEATNGEVAGDQNFGEEEQNYASSRLAISLWTLPFEEAFELLKKQFYEGTRHQAISLSQQSKFINYVDTQLLQIQRKFIKNQSESAITYSLAQLLDDLSPVVDLLWFLLLDHESPFGQDEYYIKLLGDLDDWVAYYTFPSLATRLAENTTALVKFFDFFQRIDTQISFLIDGYEVSNGQYCKMSSTGVVRLSPIVMRLRLTIIDKLEPSRAVLNASREIPANDEVLNILDIEIGRLFEGILERI